MTVEAWLATYGERVGGVLGTGAVFDHVAHAAPRIRDLLPIYQELLGGTFLRGGTHSLGFRDVQLGYADGSKMELIEPTEGSTFLDSFFRRHPQGGLHHITFLVPDVRAAVAAAERAGCRVHGVSYERIRWQEAFLHPSTFHGALVQLAQPGGDYRHAHPEQRLDEVLDGRG
jgi:methylmalonyl-CoA/ethylmalonyl-CoA epimerase